jgi:hypothetical protein
MNDMTPFSIYHFGDSVGGSQQAPWPTSWFEALAAFNIEAA